MRTAKIHSKADFGSEFKYGNIFYIIVKVKHLDHITVLYRTTIFPAALQTARLY